MGQSWAEHSRMEGRALLANCNVELFTMIFAQMESRVLSCSSTTYLSLRASYQVLERLLSVQ